MPGTPDCAGDPDTTVATLANGVRVVVLRLPAVATAAVSVFVRSGSQHESARLNGISHVIEHMAFKGTRSRDCQQINLDAERLGAEVNAHTDKDHTAFYMRALPQHAAQLLRQLALIVQHPSYPADELERERQVLLQEFTEDEDDPVATAFKLFDKACFGLHPAAQPVMVVRHCAEHGSPHDLLRAAYHLGNRHVQLELRADRLLLEPDHVLADMLRHMHLLVNQEHAPFEPEAGAYASGAAHAGAHDHGHDHAQKHDQHDHDHHGHGHEHDPKRSHKH